jgi:hypothetical protein
MDTPRDIARLIGPILMVLSLSEALNFYIWKKAEAPVVYLNGLLLFTGGLALIRAHNNWSIQWPILITLIGWLSLALGLYRIFFPNGKQLERGTFSYVTLAILFLIGFFLTVKSYL